MDWYYIKYLYHHNEQFLDLFEFITNNTQSAHEDITSQIKDYFTLPFIQLKEDETTYVNMSIKGVLKKVMSGISRETLANIERINSNRYSYKLDFLLFCGHLRLNGNFEGSRLERVMNSATEKELPTIKESIAKLYQVCDVEGRLNALNYLEENGDTLGIDFDTFFEDAYKNGEKDLIYYGVRAKTINRYYTGYRRK